MSAGLFLGTSKMYEQSLPFCCLTCVGDDEAGFAHVLFNQEAKRGRKARGRKAPVQFSMYF